MLQRHVEIVADIGSVADDVEDLQREFRRVGIMEADPVEAGDVGEPVEQIREGPAPIDIEAIVSQFLGDQHDLLYTVTHEAFGFFDEVFDRAADVAAAHKRDGAEGAAAVTAFGYFEISVVLGSGQKTFAKQFGFIVGFELFQQEGQFEGAKPGIDLGDLLFKIIAIALTETTGDKDLIKTTLLFELYLAENSIDGFLFGFVDKATGVDDDDIVVFPAVLVNDVDIVGAELTAQHFAVHHILAAAESDDVYLILM
jgi:hypothetical protein